MKRLDDVAGQLHVLLLVLSHRHIVGLIEENVRSHERGISEEATVDIVRILGRLILKLGHTRQFTKHGIAVEHPAQLGMLVDVGLDEQGVLLRVQTTGNILGQLLQRAPTQVGGVLTHGDGVQVCHEIVTIIFLSPGRPILNAPK